MSTESQTQARRREKIGYRVHIALAPEARHFLYKHVQDYHEAVAVMNGAIDKIKALQGHWPGVGQGQFIPVVHVQIVNSEGREFRRWAPGG